MTFTRLLKAVTALFLAVLFASCFFRDVWSFYGAIFFAIWLELVQINESLAVRADKQRSDSRSKREEYSRAKESARSITSADVPLGEQLRALRAHQNTF